MNSLRKVLSFLMVLTFAVLALPASADDDKKFSLNMAVTPPALSPATVTAKFTNQNNSSFNSLTLNAPAGLEITGTPTATRGTASIVSTGSGNRVKVININLPAGTGQFVTLTLTVKRTSTGCGNTTGNWTGQPWSGSGLNGSKFDIASSSSNTSTTISGGCMSFLANPANALVGAVITDSPYSTAGNAVRVS